MANQNSNGMGGGPSKSSNLFSKFRNWLLGLAPEIPLIVGGSIAAVAVTVSVIVSVSAANNPKNHVHSYGEWSVEKAATCTTEGISVRYCDCGERQDAKVDALGHHFGEWEVTSNETCKDVGTEKRSCECGETETREIAKNTSHIEVIDEAVSATCTSVGLTEGKHCSVCGAVTIEQKEIAVLPHTYDDRYDDSCNKCDYIRVADCPHNNTVTIPGKEATCTNSGVTEGKRCLSCGEDTVKQTEIIALGHVESAWITDSNATCTVSGVKHTECTVCKEKIKDGVIDKVPHRAGIWIIDSNATCTDAGSKHTDCNVCGNKVQTESIPALGHLGNEWIYDAVPTCTESGARHKLCSRCSCTFDGENLSALGHVEGAAVKENEVKASCTEDGYYYSVVYCSASGCNYEFSRTRKTLESEGHDYSGGYCTVCSAVDPYPGAIRIYSYTDLVNVKNNLSGTYVLMNDIDCEGLAILAIGSTSENAFTGLFEGQGYTISNYTVSLGDNIGIFGYNKGTIRNLNVEDFTYDISPSSSNEINVGGIVGLNNGLIEKCTVKNGKMQVFTKSTCRVGLVTGHNYGNVYNCFVQGDVYLSHSSRSELWRLAGGVTGTNRGNIKNCFVEATVYAYGLRFESDKRGEAGLVSATNEKGAVISNCVVKGCITEGNNRQGDICGRSDGEVTNCYRDENVVLSGSGSKFYRASAQSLNVMSNSSFYSGSLSWDPNVWNFTNVNLENELYPTLKQK